MHGVSIRPPKLEFLGVAPGRAVTLPLRIVNTTSLSIKVRMQGPQTGVFKLQAEVTSQLPPGLTQTVHVSFYSKDESKPEFHDSILIYTPNEEIEVPLFAERCRPHLAPTVETLDFGNLIPGYPISRTLTLANSGTEDATFNLEVNDAAFEQEQQVTSKTPSLKQMLGFNTSTGVVPMGGKKTVSLTIQCETTGTYRGVVLIKDQYGHQSLLNVSCCVVEPSLIYFQYADDIDGTNPLATIPGNANDAIYETVGADPKDPHAHARRLVPLETWRCNAKYQESTSRRIVAQNISPYTMCFEFQVEVRERKALCDLNSAGSGPVQSDDPATDFITVTPATGTLKPGEKIELEITFAPKLDLLKIERLCRFMTNTLLSDWSRIFGMLGKQVGTTTDFDGAAFDATLVEKMPLEDLKRLGSEFYLFRYNLDNVSYVFEVRTRCSVENLHRMFVGTSFFSVSALATRPLVSVSDNLIRFTESGQSHPFTVKNMSLDPLRITIKAPSAFHIGDPLNHNELTVTLQPKEARIFQLFFLPKSSTLFNDYMYVYLGNTEFYQVTVNLVTNKDKALRQRIQNTRAILDTANSRLVKDPGLGKPQLMTATELQKLKFEKSLACDKTYMANRLKMVQPESSDGKARKEMRNYTKRYLDPSTDSSESDDAKYELQDNRLVAQTKTQKPFERISAYNDVLDLGMADNYGKNDYDSNYKNKRLKSKVQEELAKLDSNTESVALMVQPKKRSTLSNDLLAPVKLFGPDNYDNLDILRFQQMIKKLTARELALISTGPMEFDFETVTVGTRMVRYFKIANDLKVHIKVSLTTSQQIYDQEIAKRRETELVEDSFSEDFTPGATLPTEITSSEARGESAPTVAPHRITKIAVDPCVQYIPPGAMAGFPISLFFKHLASQYTDTIRVFVNDGEYGLLTFKARIEQPSLRLNVKSYSTITEARELLSKYANVLLKVSLSSKDRERGQGQDVPAGPSQITMQMLNDIVFFDLNPTNVYSKKIERELVLTNVGTSATAVALNVAPNGVFSRTAVSNGEFIPVASTALVQSAKTSVVDGERHSSIVSAAHSTVRKNSRTHRPNSGSTGNEAFMVNTRLIEGFENDTTRTISLLWQPTNAEISTAILTLQAAKGAPQYVPIMARLAPGRASFVEKGLDYGLINIGKVVHGVCTLINKSSEAECYFELIEGGLVRTSSVDLSANNIDVEIPRGRLAPEESLQIQISLTAMCLGKIDSKISFRIIGGEKIDLPIHAIVEAPHIIVTEVMDTGPSLSVAQSPGSTTTVTRVTSPQRNQSQNASRDVTRSRKTPLSESNTLAGAPTGRSGRVVSRTGRSVSFQNTIQPEQESTTPTFESPLVIRPSHIDFSAGVTQSIPTLKKLQISNHGRVAADFFIDCTLAKFVSLTDIGTDDSTTSHSVVSTLITRTDLLERFRILSDAQSMKRTTSLQRPQDRELTLASHIEDTGEGVTETLLRAQDKLIDQLAKRHNLPIFPHLRSIDYQTLMALLINSNEIPDPDGSGKLRVLSQLGNCFGLGSDSNKVMHVYLPPGGTTTVILSVVATEQLSQVRDCVFFYILGQTPYSSILTNAADITFKDLHPQTSDATSDALTERDMHIVQTSPEGEGRNLLSAYYRNQELKNTLILSYSVHSAVLMAATPLINFGIKIADSAYKQGMSARPPMFQDLYRNILNFLGLGVDVGMSQSSTIHTDTHDASHVTTGSGSGVAKDLVVELPFISQMAPSGLYFQDINISNQSNRIVLFVILVTDYDDRLLSNKLYSLNQSFGRIQAYDNISFRVFFSPTKVGVHHATLKLYYRELVRQDEDIPIEGEGTHQDPELAFFCNRGFVNSPYLTIHLRSVAVFRTLVFSANPLIFPNTAVCMPSRCIFYIRNLGYKHNARLTINFPPELSKIAFSVIWPLGNTINHMIRLLPVIISFVSVVPMSFSSRCVICDDEGIPYGLTINGNCANEPYLLKDYMRTNYKRILHDSGPPTSALCEPSFTLVPRGVDPYSLDAPEFGVYHSYRQLAAICQADENDPLLRHYGLNKHIILALESIGCKSLIEFSDYSKSMGLEETFNELSLGKDLWGQYGATPLCSNFKEVLGHVSIINSTVQADTSGALTGRSNQPPSTSRTQLTGKSSGGQREKGRLNLELVQRLLIGPFATTEYPRYPNAHHRLSFYWHFLFRSVGTSSESCLTPYIKVIPDMIGYSLESMINISFMTQVLCLLLNLRLNMNLPFPQQFTASVGKTNPFLIWACTLMRKTLKIDSKLVQNLPSIPKKRIDFLFSCYDELLTSLKINGAMLTNLPCELLLGKQDFLLHCSWTIAKMARNAYTYSTDSTEEEDTYDFEPQLASPMISQTNSTIILDLMQVVHELSHRTAWYFVISELIRIYVLSTTRSPKGFDAALKRHRVWITNEACEFGLRKGIFRQVCEREPVADFYRKWGDFCKKVGEREDNNLMLFLAYHTSFMLYGTEFQKVVILREYVPETTEIKERKVGSINSSMRKNITRRSLALSANPTPNESRLNESMSAPPSSAPMRDPFYIPHDPSALFSGLEIALTILSHYPYAEGLTQRVETLLTVATQIAKAYIDESTDFTVSDILTLRIRTEPITERLFNSLEAARAALWGEIEQFLRFEFNIVMVQSGLYLTSSTLVNYAHNSAYVTAVATNHQLLATLLYQILPSFIPDKTLRIVASLGDTVSQPLEVANTAKNAVIKYRTSLLYPRRDDAAVGGVSCEIRLSTPLLTVEPRLSGTLTIKMTPRFAKQCAALVGLRPSYESHTSPSGTFQAPTFVMLVIDTNDSVPVKVYEVESRCQQQAKISIDVENKNGVDASYQIRIVEKFVALDATSLNTVARKPKRTFNYMEPLAAQLSKSQTQGRHPIEPATEPLCGVETSPIAFKTNERILKIRARNRQSMNLYYAPTHPGAYVASIFFEDANLGTFMYELRGYSILPDVSQTYNLSTLVQENRAFSLDLSELLTSDGRHRFVNYGLYPIQDQDEKQKIKKRDPKSTLSLTSKINPETRVLTLQYQPAAKPEPGVHAYRLLLATDTFTRQAIIYLSLLKKQEEIQMEMVTPARETVVQKIPIRNNTDVPAQMSLTATSHGVGQSKNIGYLRINGRQLQDGVPVTLTVEPGDTPFTTIDFSPSWIMSFTARLVIKNVTQDIITDEYTLKCSGTEPLASGTITLETVAMEPVTSTLTISYSPTSAMGTMPCKYQIYLQDKKNVFSIDTTALELRPGESGRVEVRGFSPCSGQSRNVLFVKNTALNTYEWYDVLLLVKPRECSGVIEIKAATNTFKQHELLIRNTREDAYANLSVDVINIPPHIVSYNPRMQIEPGATQNFVLSAKPTCRGTLKGVLIFNSMELGEFWYELVITCDEIAIKEETMHSLLSQHTTSKIIIENPNLHTVLLFTIENTNHNAFTSQPKQTCTVAPSSQEVIRINYRPTKINAPEDAEFYLSGVDSNGVLHSEYRFIFHGFGQMPKEQTVTRIYANVNSSNAGVVNFKNPFLTSSLVCLEYENTQDLQFNIRPELILQPLCDVQIPFTFSPRSLKAVRAKLRVRVQQLKDTEAGIDTADLLRMGESTIAEMLANTEVYTFVYPIEAIAEITLNETFAFLSCAARNSVSTTKSVPFESISKYPASDLQLFVEPINLKTMKTDTVFPIAQRSVTFSYKPATSALQSSSRIPQTLPAINASSQLTVVFSPMKPFACDVNLIIAVRNSGRYKLPLQLVANSPKPESVITVELAGSNSEGSYTLHITNIYNVYTEFKAFFSPTSSERFSVSPASGILEPAPNVAVNNPKTTQIRITCAPGSSQARGQLMVETKDVLFIWDVVSGFKKYVPPAGVSKVVCHDTA
ncbi:hypothetical protein GMRT_10041 [Giardia muris]|uniref:MSP domain-containing protein n=1 Tax=Giardia muris TaxID=5742 RepID=A0A4Z1T6E4_GIAMU|nr:hypothetical protein GMRT_10041 [Giardia muris]|eukprot:TNJ28041.1 hypothetical protein GMRT_10041 [Giardia muris]